MCCFFLGEKKIYLAILSDRFYIKFYVKGLVYNFHHFISLKQLEDFNRMLVSFNFTEHGQLNLTYETRIWKIEHFKNSLL